MSWSEYRRKSKLMDELRREEAREANEYFLFAIPSMPAIFMLQMGDIGNYVARSRDPWLHDLEQYFGGIAWAYAVVAAYFFAIGLFMFFFAGGRAAWSRVTVSWLCWAWFYYALYEYEALKPAFTGLLMLTVLLLPVGHLASAWRIIRERMFLSKD
ncbi:MAG: hypothetical protein QNJ00_13945 [Woeseiaceae bacterium]|nr:hypothetical protein [Woeseiaceae bacterium]